MKVILIVLCTILNLVSTGDVRAEFRKAMAKFAEKDRINLAEGLQTRTARFQSFVKFHSRVEEINNDDSRLFTAEDNFLSILTEAERKSRLGYNSTLSEEEEEEEEEELEMLKREDGSDGLPVHRDFGGVISDIKDQGECGSCWTFSGTGALEGEIFFQTGDKKVDLSEREFLECVTSEDYDGCQGGFQQWCFKYAKKYKRIAPTSAYPYAPEDSGVCQVTMETPNALEDHNVRVKGVKRVYVNKLKQVASKHILAVAIYVNNDFLAYRRGIYMDTRCQRYPNHAVVLVGYGARMGHQYWKIRNSWGTDWGEQGYILMDREVDNICKIGSYAYYPIVGCRDDTCKAPHPDEGDNGEEEFATEATDNICYNTPLKLGTCRTGFEVAMEACVKSGIPQEQCWVYSDDDKCHRATEAGATAETGVQVEAAKLCDGAMIEDDTCRDKIGLSPCKDSKEAAEKICRLSGLPGENCMIVKVGETCYKGSVPFTSSGGSLRRSRRCENVTEAPERDCSKDFGPGVIFCYECNCCKHHNFCDD